MESACDETRTLRRTMRDLVALTAMPAMWERFERRRITESLADVLLNTLRLEFVYIHLRSRGSEHSSNIVRIPHRAAVDGEEGSIVRVLEPWLTDAAGFPRAIPNPLGSGILRLALAPLGFDWEEGLLIAGSGNEEFPADHDRVLLGVAANQATMVLQRQQAEQAIRDSEQRFRGTFENAAVGIAHRDLHGRFLHVNSEFCRIVGYSCRELLTKTFQEITHPQDLPFETRPFASLVQAESANYSLEKRYVRKDGSPVWVEVSVSLQRDASGRPAYIIAVVVDISRRKRAEEELRRANARLELGVRGSKIGIWEFDLPNGRIDDSRANFINLWEQLGQQRPKSPIDFATVMAIVHPEDRAPLQRAIEAYLGGQTVQFEIEHRVLHVDGTDRWMLSRGVAMRNAAGRPERFIGSSIEISDHKQAAEKLRRSESLLNDAQQLAHIGAWRWDIRDGRLRWSEEIYRIFGLDPAGRAPTHDHFMALLHPEDRAKVDGMIDAALKGTGTYEGDFRIVRSGGEVRVVYSQGKLVRDPTGEAIEMVGIAQDITERKRQAIRQQALADASLKITTSLSVAQPIDATMQLVADLTRQIIGAHVAVIGLAITQDWAQSTVVNSLSDKYAPAQQGDPTDGLRSMVCQATHPLRLTQEQLLEQPGFWSAGPASPARPPVRGLLAVPLLGRDGRNLGFLQISDKYDGDFTAEDEAIAVQLGAMASVAIENSELYQVAREADRRKDEFLANVSHEIRTPMNAILGMAELALDSPLTALQRKYLTTVKASAESLLGVINDLLDFSKIKAGKIELTTTGFWLRSLLNDTVRSIAFRAHRKGLEIACRVDDDVPDALLGDPGRLRQVLLNLIGNAIKFTESGEVFIRVRVDEAEAAPDTTGLVFEVSDSGIGIAPERLARIFDAFEQGDNSTTRRYGGTGLGLSISSRLVEIMGGRITVDSRLGTGSTFRFNVQIVRQPRDSTARSIVSPVDLSGVPVLIVGGHPTTRLMLEQWLRGWQAEPSSVGDGRTAFQILVRAALRKQPYRLVLLDAKLRDSRAEFFADTASHMRLLTDCRIILMSSDDRAQTQMPRGIAAFASKPVFQDELLDVVCRVLSQPLQQPGAQDSSPQQTTQPLPGGQNAPATPGLRVLLAEDNEFNLEVIQHLLERKGHMVTAVTNGREALAKLEQRAFDLLLLDCHMPEMDGFQVIETIRRRENKTQAHLPVIALTALSMKGDRERCLQAGMDDYLAKPISTGEFYAMLDRVAGRTPRAPLDSEGPHGTELIDAATLLSACGSDAGLLEKMAQSYRELVPTQLAEVENSIISEAPAKLKKAAHKLHGLVSAFSSAAAEAAYALEQMGANGDLNGAAEHCTRLAELVHALSDSLTRLTVEDLKQRVHQVVA